MSDHFPSGWISIKLEDISEDISYGYTASSNSEGVGPKFLRITDIQENKVVWDLVPYCNIDNAKKSSFLLSDGDLVFARTGATVGKSFLIKGSIPESVFASYLIRVRPIKRELSSYLGYFFKSLDYWKQITEFSSGIGQPNVNGSKLKALKVPLPPLAEQTRIAQKLNELLAQVDTLKSRIDGIPTLLKRFRQSVLAAAVSGRLTEDWRKVLEVPKENPTPFKSALVFSPSEQGRLPKKWSWEMLTKLALLESGHTPRKSVTEYWENGDVPWISLQDIRAADGKEIFETKYMPTELGIKNSSARLLPKGTVCFSRDISVGYVTVMGRSMATTQHFANWVCKEKIKPKYLMYAFMASRDHLTMSGQGSTVKTIYMPALKELRLATPSIEEQTEIVRRVEQLFAFADQLEAKVKTAQARIDQLTQSILAKAFRGELVPQDPNDEPASVLLERIKAQRAAEPKAKRGKKKAESV
ncbi:restriction endonuclease subunit S [Pseudomonas luteola]|uniref:restriction endonuclease subunit S n=1 Tax=Pseudomonas luteola TaxID=47886 RepID=UPI003DA1148D